MFFFLRVIDIQKFWQVLTKLNNKQCSSYTNIHLYTTQRSSPSFRQLVTSRLQTRMRCKKIFYTHHSAHSVNTSSSTQLVVNAMSDPFLSSTTLGLERYKDYTQGMPRSSLKLYYANKENKTLLTTLSRKHRQCKKTMQQRELSPLMFQIPHSQHARNPFNTKIFPVMDTV